MYNKKYETSPERMSYKRDWNKENTTNLTGVRSIDTIRVYNERMEWVVITPNDFLFHNRTQDIFQVYDKDLKVHVPRSLVKRARITINKNTGAIIATNSMPAETNDPTTHHLLL